MKELTSMWKLLPAVKMDRTGQWKQGVKRRPQHYCKPEPNRHPPPLNRKTPTAARMDSWRDPSGEVPEQASPQSIWMEVLSPATGGDSIRGRHRDLRASQREDCHVFFNCEWVKEILKKMRKHFKTEKTQRTKTHRRSVNPRRVDSRLWAQMFQSTIGKKTKVNTPPLKGPRRKC